MADSSSLQTLIVALIGALFGGLTAKLVDIVYQENKQRRSEKETATTFVDKHLDPLLKSADEVTGKLSSWAKGDFKAVHAVEQVVEKNEKYWQNHEFTSMLFLFGRFWAQIEIIRREGMSVAMAQDSRGAQLQNFLDCLESQKIRLIERILQRSIGEVFADEKNMTYVKFIAELEQCNAINKWVYPLAKILSRMRHTSERQRLLQYGIVVHAIIDSLDPDHLVTRDRPSWPNKLSRRSWRDLNHRVFGVYLRFVANRQKYIGPPKKAARD